MTKHHHILTELSLHLYHQVVVTNREVASKALCVFHELLTLWVENNLYKHNISDRVFRHSNEVSMPTGNK